MRRLMKNILFDIKEAFATMSNAMHIDRGDYEDMGVFHALFLENLLPNAAIIAVIVLMIVNKNAYNIMFGDGFIKGKSISWFLFGMKELCAATSNKWILYPCFFLILCINMRAIAGLFSFENMSDNLYIMLIFYLGFHFVIGKLMMQKFGLNWAAYAIFFPVFISAWGVLITFFGTGAYVTEELYERLFVKGKLGFEEEHNYYMRYNIDKAVKTSSTTKYSIMIEETRANIADMYLDVLKRIEKYGDNEETRAIKQKLKEIDRDDKELKQGLLGNYNYGTYNATYDKYYNLMVRMQKIKAYAETYMNHVDNVNRAKIREKEEREARRRKQEWQRKQEEKEWEEERREKNRQKQEQERRRAEWQKAENERKRAEWQRAENERRQKEAYERASSEGSGSTTDFFRDCNSKSSIDKRYRDLTKVYHPDQGNGSEEIFKEIQNQYEKKKKKYQN